MGTKEKSSKGKKIKVNNMKIAKEKVEELTDKQAKRIKGGTPNIRKGNWILDISKT